jgi:hypothetical protein
VSLAEAVDELAQVLQAATKAPCPIAFWSRAYSGPTGYGELFAGAIIAAGYRKPRTITTAEELDALPFGSVILDPVGLSLHKNEFAGWRASNGAKEIPADMLAREALPATVLYEPEPTK